MKKLFIFLLVLTSCDVHDTPKVVKKENTVRVKDCVVKGFRLTTGKRQRFITTLQRPNGSFIEFKTMGITYNIGDTVDLNVTENLVIPIEDRRNVTEIMEIL
jgi:uncharacterized protein (UPF0128 family)